MDLFLAINHGLAKMKAHLCMRIRGACFRSSAISSVWSLRQQGVPDVGQAILPSVRVSAILRRCQAFAQLPSPPWSQPHPASFGHLDTYGWRTLAICFIAAQILRWSKWPFRLYRLSGVSGMILYAGIPWVFFVEDENVVHCAHFSTSSVFLLQFFATLRGHFFWIVLFASCDKFPT